MKAIRKIYIAVSLMTFGCIGASAQKVIYESVPTTKVDTIELHYFSKYHSRLADNWSIEALASGRVLFAEEDSHLSMGKRLSPAFQLGVRKDVSPDVAFRGVFAIGGLKGWNAATPGLYKWEAEWSDKDPVRQYLEGKGVDCSNGYEQNLRYFTVGLDAMFNLWNMWTTNNQLDRKWNPYIFGGVEYFQLMKHEGYFKTYKIGGHAGLKCDYKVSDCVDITGEMAMAVQPATFDNEIGKGHHMDTYAYASLGVNIHLGKRGYRIDHVLPTGEYVRLGNVVTGIKEQYEIPSAQTAIIGDLFAPSVVFDDDADTYSEELQMVNLSRMAQYMLDNPKLKISVVGNTHKVGQKLAQRRAEIVREKLIERYNIEANRLAATTIDVNNEFGIKGGDQSVHFGVTR